MSEDFGKRTAFGINEWFCEVYRFDSLHPSDADFDDNFESAEVDVFTSPKLAGLAGAISQRLQNNLFGADTSLFESLSGRSRPRPKVVIKTGLTSITLNRSKLEPDAECSLSFVGQISDSVTPGNWVVLSKSVDGVNLSAQYIGQIESVSTSYAESGDGTLVIKNNAVLREWSTVLTTGFRYDIQSVEASLLESENVAGTAAVLGSALDSLGVGNQQDKNKLLSEILESSFDPFELAHSVMLLIGAMNAADALNDARLRTDTEFPLFSQRPPRVPHTVMARLGVNLARDSSVISAGALGGDVPAPDKVGEYQSRLVRVATGTQMDASYNDGEWDGLFRSGGITEISRGMRENYENNRKIKAKSASPFAHLNGQNISAWGIISTYCEPTLNEFFTDIWQEGSGAGIISSPVVVMRDKPFATRHVVFGEEFKDDYKNYKFLETIENEYSFFDDLPRIKIKEESIMTFNLNSTFLTSPNYIMANFQESSFSKGISASMSAAVNRVNMKAAMSRFGGQESYADINYIGQQDLDGGFSAGTIASLGGADNYDILDHFGILLELQRIWYSYLYRMARGTVTLKGNNTHLKVGMNTQLKVGHFTLVGHIEGFTENVIVNEEGLTESATTVQLTRLTYLTNEDNNVRLMPLGGWNRLFDREYHSNLMGSAENMEEQIIRGLAASAAARIADELRRATGL